MLTWITDEGSTASAELAHAAESDGLNSIPDGLSSVRCRVRTPLSAKHWLSAKDKDQQAHGTSGRRNKVTAHTEGNLVPRAVVGGRRQRRLGGRREDGRAVVERDSSARDKLCARRDVAVVKGVLCCARLDGEESQSYRCKHGGWGGGSMGGVWSSIHDGHRHCISRLFHPRDHHVCLFPPDAGTPRTP